VKALQLHARSDFAACIWGAAENHGMPRNGGQESDPAEPCQSAFYWLVKRANAVPKTVPEFNCLGVFRLAGVLRGPTESGLRISRGLLWQNLLDRESKGLFLCYQYTRFLFVPICSVQDEIEARALC